MEPDINRSQQVVEAYKRDKLAASVLNRIRQIIQGFEEDRKIDRQFAGVGMAALLILGSLAIYFIRFH